MQRKTPLSRLAKLAVVSVLMVLAAWAVWPQVERYQQQRLALALAERMNAENCRQLLRRLTKMDPPAIEAMVVAVTHPDTKVSQQARKAIDQHLATWRHRWEADPRFEIEDRLNRLAAALAQHVERFGPRGRQWATSVALELIELANGLPPRQSVDLLAHCDGVLNAPPPQRAVDWSLPPVAQSSEEEFDEPLSSTQPEIELSTAPGELIPDLAFPNPIPQSEGISQEDGPTLVQESVSINSDPRAAGRIARWAPAWVRQQSPTSSIGPQSSPGKVDEARQVELAQQIREVPSPRDLEDAREHLRAETTDALILRLGDADLYTAGAIKQVLRERNVREPEWDLRARLLADDADERLRAIDQLNLLPARTARLLLQRLLKDPDARIRHQALSTLATSRDPALFDLAQDMAFRDEDPTVTELASRIVRELR